MTAAPADWPPFMPGTHPDDLRARGPRTPREHAAVLLDEAAEDIVVAADLRAGLPESIGRLAREASDAIGAVRRHVHSAAAAIDRAAEDDMIPDRARERLDREAREAAAAALRDLDARAGTSLDLLEAGLTATAQPEFPAGADRAEARDEFRMLVGHAPDPAEKVRELATGTDQRLAAIAASSYGRSYLRSRGVAEDAIAAVAAFAAQAALSSGDPTREAAARGLQQLPRLRKARQKAMHGAHFAIG